MSDGRAGTAAWIALFAALVITLTFQYGSVGFLPGHHGYNSSMGLSIARNLGSEHRFTMFTRMSVESDGKVRFHPHNRLPLLSFALVRLAVSPFHDDPAWEIRIARRVMSLFFWGALVLAFEAIRCWSGRPLLAAAVSLISFSSYYLQYYHDMVFNDTPALFGFLLLLLGITRWEMHRSPGMLYGALFLGIGFGWQGFGALGAWWSLDLIRVARATGLHPVRAARELLRRQATRALLIAAAWGGTLLAFNLFNEWRLTGQDFGELPSVRSIRFRVGLAGSADEFPEYPELRWGSFLERQVRRVLKATAPAGALHATLSRLGDAADSWFALLVAAAAATAFLLGWRLVRMEGNRFILATLLSSGFFWTIPMRNFTAFHEYESVFYVGFALVFYTAILAGVPRRALGVCLLLSLGLYAYSNLALNAEKEAAAEPFSARTHDFAAIRKLVGERRRILLGGDPDEFSAEAKVMRFYLSGNYYSEREGAEFVISRNRDYNSHRLTPGNKEIFLFRNQ